MRLTGRTSRIREKFPLLTDNKDIIIVACPGLYRTVKLYSTSRQKYYVDDSHSNGNYARSHGRTTDDHDVQIRSYPRTTVPRMDRSSSQEELVCPGKLDSIMVTKAVVVDRSEGTG